MVGNGRQDTRRNAARAAGDMETFRKLQPPSEIPLEKCGALTKTGAPCRHSKGQNTDHPGFGYCNLHGGNTQAGIKSAMMEMAEQFASEYKRDRRFGGNRHDPEYANYTPEQALLEEVRRSAAMVRFLEERIGRWNLASDDTERLQAILSKSRYDHTKASLKREIKSFLDELPQEDASSGYHLPRLSEVNPATGFVSFTDAHTWLTLYRDERTHLARVAKMSIDAGVAQRLVTIAEDQGRVLASAIRAVLSALSLSEQQEQMIPRIVPPILRAVASDQPIPDISSLLTSSTPKAIE